VHSSGAARQSLCDIVTCSQMLWHAVVQFVPSVANRHGSWPWLESAACGMLVASLQDVLLCCAPLEWVP
jgi:hypothetical protein